MHFLLPFLASQIYPFYFTPPRCKSKVIGTEVFIDSAAEVTFGLLEYREAKSERLTAILREKGRKAVEMEILFDYFSGMMQGEDFPKAIEAAETEQLPTIGNNMTSAVSTRYIGSSF